MTQPANPSAPTSAPQRHLTLFDSTNIIVGIIIGSTIYEMTPLIAMNVSGPWLLVGVWVLGGVLSLIGALCYTELATAYPKEGGDYVYLTRAFGRRMGFVFAWCQLWIVRPGSIGVMGYVFARYADQLIPLSKILPALGPVGSEQLALLFYAVVSIVVLTGINILGVKQGKWTQNILTLAKFLGLAAVCVIGLLYTRPAAEPAMPAATKAVAASESSATPATAPNDDPSTAQPAAAPEKPKEEHLDYGLALILILFAYGGWSEMAYVGAEVRDPKRNILRALLLGTIAVGACYVLATVAFLHALGFEGIRGSKAVAADVLRLAFGELGGKFISLLICVSALGAINGLIFTGARIYYAMGTDHQLYAVLGRWHERLGTPVWSLVIQGVITLIPVIAFGLREGAFTRLVDFTTPVFWGFMVLVALSVYRLREIEPDTPRPYRVPGYPFTPFIFGVSSLFMLYRGLLWAYINASAIAYWTIVILAAGLVASLYDPRPPEGASRPSESV
ncbi:MAG: amino acid permease [Thermoguttaceae bacterium]|jgi:amino acid transporter|nr:amino acid permease [Thermoguttaceae bacterium]